MYRLYGPVAYIERTKQLMIQSSKQLDRNCHLFTSVVVRNTTAPNVLCRCSAGKKVRPQYGIAGCPYLRGSYENVLLGLRAVSALQCKSAFQGCPERGVPL